MIALLPREQDASSIVVVFVVMTAIYSVFGVICAVVAPSRGRSPIGWFFIGVATQCLGVRLVCLRPNLKREEERRRRRDAETRKLREQLKKERQTADERHNANRTRLGIHDRALRVDTSSADGPQLANAGSPPPVPASLPPPVEAAWYFASGGERLGPVPTSRLKQLWLDKRIDDDVLVWKDGMGDWTPINEIVDLLDDGPMGSAPMEA